jgi:hypothetical protein
MLEPPLLGQHRVGNAQPRRRRSRRIQRNAEPYHHETVDIDRQRDARTADRQALFAKFWRLLYVSRMVFAVSQGRLRKEQRRDLSRPLFRLPRF